MSAPLISWSEKGLFCAEGGFHIDPHGKVPTAVVTHAHSDHARRGHGQYICSASGVELLRARLGKKIAVRSVAFGETFRMGKVEISLHPAGHILGSAQVRVRRGGEVWVASGDYKRDPDPSCEPFEAVKCDTFITEATFGTPRYVWDKGREHGREIHEWWMRNAEQDKNSVLFAYSLGKAQRVLAELAPYASRPVVAHRAVVEMARLYERAGHRLAPTVDLESVEAGGILSGELVLAPQSVLASRKTATFERFETAFASGWMHGASRRFGESYDRGFVISDHADWDDINRTIEETGARRVFVLHRGNGALVKHLRRKGLEAFPVAFLSPAAFREISETTLPLF